RIKVLQDFADGSELVSYLECNELPAVVLLDIKMPIMDGYKTAACIKKHFPSIKIIAMSSFDNEFAVAQIMKKGAASFISKNAEPEEMYDAIL
ncbi:response regulator transcription factor, partial [Acinetobacter baumannii]